MTTKNRIKHGTGLLAKDEDVIVDLIGYLVLLKIALKRKSNDEDEEFVDCYDYNLQLLDAIDSKSIFLLGFGDPRPVGFWDQSR